MADIRLSAVAEADILQILAWTQEHFGSHGRARYERLMVTALRDIAKDPVRTGSIIRSELGEGILSYHLRHSRDRARLENGVVRKPRHLLLYRIVGPDLVGIGRVLHDSMELERHLPSDYGTS